MVSQGPRHVRRIGRRIAADEIRIPWNRSLNCRYGKGMGARLAMLRRQRPKQARDLARDVMLVHGLVTAWKCARARYELGALLALLRVIGTGVGFIAWAARR